MNPHQLAPDLYRAVAALEGQVRQHVDAALLHLVKLRASIVNGCAFCVDMHSREALAEGEDSRRLFAVAAWRESPFFTDAERGALSLTDAVTRLGDHGVDDATWQEAIDVLGEETVAELLYAIGTINLWNRIAVASHAMPPPLAPA